MLSIVPVVEGDGETRAFPLLLRRLLHEKYKRFNLAAGQAVTARGRSKLLTDFEKFIRYAEGKPGCGAILVLLDADEDCPIELATRLSIKCNLFGVVMPVAIVCAKREYEAWFLASLETIKGHHGIPVEASFSGDAEEMWLR